MSRSVLTLGGLLAVALTLSFLSSRSTGETAGRDLIRLLDIREDSLEALRWITPDTKVEIVAKSDAHGRWYQVLIESFGTNGGDSTSEDDPAGDNEPAGDLAEDSLESTEDDETGPKQNGSGKMTPPGSRVIFTGGPQTERLMEAVSPLLATRRLDKVPADRLEPMGLFDTNRRMEVMARGRAHVLEIGGRTYGGGHQYLRRPGEDSVYLVEAGPLRPVEHGARRLMKREILDVRRNDLEKLVVQSHDGRRVTMLHRRQERDGGRSYFSDERDPDRRVEQYDNWIGKVLSLRAVDYVQDTESKKDLEPALRLEFTTEAARAAVIVEIYKRPGESGEVEWYAHSDHTRALVSLSTESVAPIIADALAILDG